MALVATESYTPEDLMSNMVADLETKAEESEPENVVRRLLSIAKMELALTISLGSITKLDLFQCGLSELPTCLSSHLPNLSILFCMKNKFTEMPAVIGSCPKLQMVSFKSNQIRSIHSEALQSQMRWLILTDNEIKSIPSTIGRCKLLQKFMLSGNNLSDLPDEIGMCHNLELIRLASNQLKEPPMSLLGLPKLAWVALSDNPFLDLVSRNDIAGSLEVLKDEDLDCTDDKEVLGKGASGITRKFTLQNGTHVAVKEYASNITSDGNPQEERRVNLAASALECDALVNVLGQTKIGSLVMELLVDFRAFGGSPSMTSCSRDVYEESDTLSPESAMKMVSLLLEAVAQLHTAGIVHGDFYGHNILVSSNDSNQIKLTDFGAAFLYDRKAEYGKSIERIEMRAFGHLVEEILELLCKNENDMHANPHGKALKLLVNTCEIPASGATFATLEAQWKEATAGM
eukprot:CAMPEP_0198300196 /NCGR_PEP_ID=MMETSP1449-20131203/47187_1 /TAXON_ID=420275 /ORGANISM="Attheya septentrionalis, Strain CCMP2084" /LENGTH=458 /DNA_ID=CAMNT_0044001947 /DNA_START=81 /DNA_END=1457 /DNA_ORIENTATION=+